MPIEITRKEQRADGVYSVVYEEKSAVKLSEDFVDVRGWIDQLLLQVVPDVNVRKTKVDEISDMLRQEARLITIAEKNFLTANYWD
jgi:hypothetical protein